MPRDRADDHLRHATRAWCIPICGRDARSARAMPAFDKALAYMGLTRRRAAARTSRSTWCSSAAAPTRASSDLRAAAGVLRGRKIARGVRMLVVPGSQQVKRQAEAEGLDRVFLEAGAEWRESGCSMCLGDERRPVGARASTRVSTSNRNFEGRQGAGRAHAAGQSR